LRKKEGRKTRGEKKEGGETKLASATDCWEYEFTFEREGDRGRGEKRKGYRRPKGFSFFFFFR